MILWCKWRVTERCRHGARGGNGGDRELSFDVQTGQRLDTIPRKTLSSSARSVAHLRLTSGMPMAHKPQPKNGTQRRLRFANHRQRPSIDARLAASWIM